MILRIHTHTPRVAAFADADDVHASLADYYADSDTPAEDRAAEQEALDLALATPLERIDAGSGDSYLYVPAS